MEKIESFRIDHEKLLPGLYVSRKDRCGGVAVTTYDVRLTAPNREPVLDIGALHTIEHLGATWLRNSSESKSVVYFGPMGCRTGFYLLLFGEKSSRDVWPTVKAMFEFIAAYEGEIPGARPSECGNYLQQDLPMARYYAKRYLERMSVPCFEYPV